MIITNEISAMWFTMFFIFAAVEFCSGQMKWSSWSRYSACSVTCGHGRQRRQRQCIKTSLSATGTCRGAKEMYSPCQMLSCPVKKVLPCNCGCTLEEPTGQIASQLPSKGTTSCEWRIVAKKGSTIALNVTHLELKSGWIRIAGGSKKTFLTLLKPGPVPKYPWKFKSEGNVMTVELLTYPQAQTDGLSVNTYLSATYKHIAPAKERKQPTIGKSGSKDDGEPNVPAIIGITACVIVIILVAVFLAVRRHKKKNAKETVDGNEVSKLTTGYDPQGKPRSNGSKEENPLMDGKNSPSLSRPERFMQQQITQRQPMMMRPNFAVQERDSSYDSVLQQNNPGNGLRMPGYPPEYFVKTPNYVADPNFMRMVPVTTTGMMLQSPPQQQYMMQVPLPPRSDHS